MKNIKNYCLLKTTRMTGDQQECASHGFADN